MPSPIGHSIAGVIVAWGADLVPGDRRWRTAPDSTAWFRRAGNGLTLACAGLAALADVDLLSPAAAHRAYTHSVGAVILVTIIAALVTGWVTRNPGPKPKRFNTELTGPTETVDQEDSVSPVGSVLYVSRVALMCGAAYASHVLLDWIAVDDTFPYGIRALWPFSSSWYISGWDLFPGTARRHVFAAASLLQNARAIGVELAVLVPIAWIVWLVRVKAFARLASEVAGRDHSLQ